MELLLDRQEEIQALKDYYQQIFTQAFESFVQFNEKFKPEVRERRLCKPSD
jgi:hypothetical protein